MNALKKIVAIVCALAAALPCAAVPPRAPAAKKAKPLKKHQQSAPKVPTRKIITPDFDIRFGRVARVQEGVAFVVISARLPEREIPPVFFACDVRLRPVAMLDTMNTGFRDCFLFKITEGKAEQNDIVIARYFKTVEVPAEQSAPGAPAEQSAPEEQIEPAEQKTPGAPATQSAQ